VYIVASRGPVRMIEGENLRAIRRGLDIGENSPPRVIAISTCEVREFVGEMLHRGEVNETTRVQDLYDLQGPIQAFR